MSEEKLRDTRGHVVEKDKRKFQFFLHIVFVEHHENSNEEEYRPSTIHDTKYKLVDLSTQVYNLLKHNDLFTYQLCRELYLIGDSEELRSLHKSVDDMDYSTVEFDKGFLKEEDKKYLKFPVQSNLNQPLERSTQKRTRKLTLLQKRRLWGLIQLKRVCDTDFVAQKSSLNNHCTTTKHITNMRIEMNEDEPPLSDEEKAVITAELILSAYAAVYDIPKLKFDTLVPVMKIMFKDSKIAENFRMDRRRIGEIIEKVLAPAHVDRLRSILQKQKFSIIVDESTDVSTTHSMCIVVRYVNFEAQKIDESLWSLKHLYSDPTNCDTSSETLTKHVIESFESENVPIEYMTGFRSDTCNVMMGCSNSVATKLKTLLPRIIINKCKCHLEHLNAKRGYVQLPKSFMSLLTLIPNHIRASGKRNGGWRWHQILQ
ncbi:hypothetical protein TKK_0016487 [Trichogramma kaykai]|uniref:DUF4371 domain-containing protein n=1 Tax=Trichogramma kaykai TaxID=54128 RepID=A0ABD2W7I2_9HYME